MLINRVKGIPFIRKLAGTIMRSRLRRPLRRIRLLGWYGFHSTGDDLMRWCIEDLFRERAALNNIDIEFTSGNDCDLCLVGGGTIIGCDTSDICRQAERIKAPLAIFGPGFRNTGPEDCLRWQPKMKALFNRAVLAGVRGPQTVSELEKYKMAHKVDIVGDPAIWFKPITLPWKPDKPTVGICVREMKNAEAGFEERYTSARETYQKFASIIPHVLDKLRAEPIFLSFAENQFDSDSNAARHVRDMLPWKHKNAIILPYCDDIRLNPSIVGQLDYLISERMHPAIIAWLLGKPCLMLENQYGKSTDFLKSINMGSYGLRTDQLCENVYMELFQKLMHTRQAIAQAANQAFEVLKKRQQSFVDSLLKQYLDF